MAIFEMLLCVSNIVFLNM